MRGGRVTGTAGACNTGGCGLFSITLSVWEETTKCAEVGESTGAALLRFSRADCRKISLASRGWDEGQGRLAVVSEMIWEEC